MLTCFLLQIVFVLLTIAAQTAIGTVGIAAGVGGSLPSGGTSVAVAAVGTVVAGNGLDNVQAGIRQTWTGKPVQTATSSAVESATGSQLAGEGTNLAIGLVGPGTVTKLATGKGLLASLKSVGSGAWESVKNVGSNVKNWWKGTQSPPYTIAENKFDYFFGRVVSSDHNMMRSLQNQKDLLTLGIKNKDELIPIINKAIGNEMTISTKTNSYGTTVTKKVVLDKGHLEISFFYEGGNMKSIPRVVTIIPKIH